MDLAAISTGIKTRLATITGLRAHDRWPATIQTPAAWPKPASLDFDETFGGAEAVRFEVIVAAGNLRDIERAQTALMGYLAESGASSIKAAIEGDETLGGEVDSVRVTGWRDYGVLELGGQQYMGAVFDLEVLL